MAHLGTGIEYALHCLLWIAQPLPKPPSSRELAALQGAPAPFVAKIFGKLEKAGLVAASAGIRGGYRLARAPEDITVLDVVDAVEGRKNLFDCQTIMLGKTMGDLFGAMATATRDALEQNGVQSLTLQTKVLDAHALGALFMIFELTVGALGEAMNINAFDQPGVEHGKIIARKILSK